MKEDTGKLFVHKTTKAAPILLLSQKALPLKTVRFLLK